MCEMAHKGQNHRFDTVLSEIAKKARRDAGAVHGLERLELERLHRRPALLSSTGSGLSW
jgi:hypothetical protein